MKCAKCGHDLVPDALFCPRCGTKTSLTTPLSAATENALPSSSRVPGKKSMGARAKLGYSFIAIVMIACMWIIFMRSLPGGDHPVIKDQPTLSQPTNYEGARLTMSPVAARVENGFIIISLADVIEKKMVGFTYEARTKKVEMMAYVSPDGKLVTSIAMCEPCNSKSFHSESKDLICDNCGTRWNFTTLEGISGSCQKYPPDPIPSEIVGGDVRISQKLVEGWKLRI